MLVMFYFFNGVGFCVFADFLHLTVPGSRGRKVIFIPEVCEPFAYHFQFM